MTTHTRSTPDEAQPWLYEMGDPFHALATPVRRFILETLAGAEVCAGELAEHVQMHFGIGWPAVTKNLKVLHRAGFVRVRDAWPNRLYRLDDDAIRRVESAVDGLRRRWKVREGGGYRSRFEPEEAEWPARRVDRRPRDADDVIDQIMLEEGFDPVTGKPLAGGVRATREIE